MKVALTGHRLERLKGETDKIKEWIKDEIQSSGADTAYCGMAEGGDILFALSIIELKKEGYPVKLCCVLPCENYSSQLPEYSIIKEYADDWIVIQEKYDKTCDTKRDRYMAEHCDKMLALWDQYKGGGVWKTMKMAKKLEKEISICPYIEKNPLAG